MDFLLRQRLVRRSARTRSVHQASHVLPGSTGPLPELPPSILGLMFTIYAVVAGPMNRSNKLQVDFHWIYAVVAGPTFSTSCMLARPMTAWRRVNDVIFQHFAIVGCAGKMQCELHKRVFYNIDVCFQVSVVSSEKAMQDVTKPASMARDARSNLGTCTPSWCGVRNCSMEGALPSSLIIRTS